MKLFPNRRHRRLPRRYEMKADEEAQASQDPRREIRDLKPELCQLRQLWGFKTIESAPLDTATNAGDGVELRPFIGNGNAHLFSSIQ